MEALRLASTRTAAVLRRQARCGLPASPRSGLPPGTVRAPSACPMRRSITIGAAKSLLGFSEKAQPTVAELRNAYFQAAKQCHPDMQHRSSDSDRNNAATTDFKDITEAYERLLNSDQVKKDETMGISADEEERYRRACLQVLGIPAEIVEESKQNPMFRHWLGGNTDGAQHWRAFFAVNGGLAQKLRPPAGFLQSSRPAPKSENRRKRRR